jgi:hypothetical protein
LRTSIERSLARHAHAARACISCVPNSNGWARAVCQFAQHTVVGPVGVTCPVGSPAPLDVVHEPPVSVGVVTSLAVTVVMPLVLWQTPSIGIEVVDPVHEFASQMLILPPVHAPPVALHEQLVQLRVSVTPL